MRFAHIAYFVSTLAFVGAMALEERSTLVERDILKIGGMLIQADIL
jgi:hypothetical protein